MLVPDGVPVNYLGMDGAQASYVLSGTLDLWVSGRHFRLQEGDSFSFKSTDVRRFANPAKCRCGLSG